MKILRKLDQTSEPYRRFVTETRVLAELRSRPGILPLLDTNLPENPSKLNPAWLTMPVATPIQRALSNDAPLHAAVEAVTSISETLANLSEEFGLNHRDIKPDNLYRYSDSWCIGDFGLVDDPRADTVTETGRLLGAAHYLAPEIYTDKPSWSAVDVYALAKTLWVLVTGHKYPLPGHLVPSYEAFRLSAYVHSDNRLPYLERLITRTTSPDPHSRPSMREFSEELRAWLNRKVEPPEAAQMDELRNRLRPAIEQRVTTERDRQVLKEHVVNRLATVKEKLQALAAAIESITGLQASYGASSGFSSSSAITQAAHLPGVYYHEYVAAVVSAPVRSSRGEVELSAGIALYITVSGSVRIAAAHIVMTGPVPKVILVWTQHESAHMGSLLELQAIQNLIAGLTNNLKPALEIFANAVDA